MKHPDSEIEVKKFSSIPIKKEHVKNSNPEKKPEKTERPQLNDTNIADFILEWKPE